MKFQRFSIFRCVFWIFFCPLSLLYEIPQFFSPKSTEQINSLKLRNHRKKTKKILTSIRNSSHRQKTSDVQNSYTSIPEALSIQSCGPNYLSYEKGSSDSKDFGRNNVGNILIFIMQKLPIRSIDFVKLIFFQFLWFNKRQELALM